MTPERRRDPFRVRIGPGLGRRMTRAVALGAGVALLVAGLIVDLSVYWSMRSSLLDELLVQARIAGENSAAPILFKDDEAAAQVLAGLLASPAAEYADLRDHAGRRVAFQGRSADPQHERSQAAPSRPGHLFTATQLWVVVPVRQGEREVGTLRLEASLDGLHQRIATYAAITLAASALAFGLSLLLVRRIRREIDESETRLDYLAYYDPVTELPNRHAANEQIARLISTVGHTSDGFALLLLDLDDFKVVNDTLGHSVGDELLRALAERLTQFMRPNDVAFRFGGDEFVILSPRVSDTTHLMLLGQAAMLAFGAPLQVGPHELRVRGSVGVAQFPRDAQDAAGLVRAADTAMYEAKSMGKNTYALFHAGLDRGAARRMRLEKDLREALQRHELRLVYQPIVDLRTQRLAGVEALLRWTHPELGAVSPVEFIPVAESSGLIVDIGQWVMLQACRQMQLWCDAGLAPPFVAVNVSARQIRRGLKAQVESALAATGVDPHRLELEITEHSLVEDIDSNLAQLKALRDLGMQIAVDDFGTGLSSLAYLKRLPLGKLKIDRTFVKDLPGSGDDAAIVSAIISMARSLGLAVVAEGVETLEQRDFLAGKGCEFIQGYLYSRPVEAAALDELMRQQAATGQLALPAAGRAQAA